jgi:hypothetical protein
VCVLGGTTVLYKRAVQPPFEVAVTPTGPPHLPLMAGPTVVSNNDIDILLKVLNPGIYF